MKKRDVVRILILRTVGNFLILFTVFGFLATFGPAAYYEASYQISKARGIKYVLAPELRSGSGSNSETSGRSELGKILDKYQGSSESAQSQLPSLLGSVLSNSSEKILVPPNTDFSIVVPRIGAAERITANVDPSNKNEYLKALINSIAHARGTAYPGVNGTTYLFAHSADSFWDIGRYNAVFYLLKDMENGDEVYLFFRGRRYDYVVYDKRIVDSSDVSYIDAALGQGERIILQTCWPPGTDWKRTLVFAHPKGI